MAWAAAASTCIALDRQPAEQPLLALNWSAHGLLLQDGRMTFYPYPLFSTRLAACISRGKSISSTSLAWSFSPLAMSVSWNGPSLSTDLAVSACSWLALERAAAGADAPLGSSVSLLGITQCSSRSGASLSLLGKSVSGREVDTVIAVRLCRAAYESAGRRHIERRFRAECLLQFNEISGDGDDIINLLDAPLMKRRMLIQQMKKQGGLPEIASELFCIICQTVDPLLPRLCRIANAIAWEMANSA
mmetsp:Transcript_76134/g.184127  ORF Transcript_76134/g.184127 Transcript_76134/m.184127 type:complete len:246 (-) Transcript_76134:210-947(-)